MPTTQIFFTEGVAACGSLFVYHYKLSSIF